MTYPGLALLVLVGVGIGAAVYYMFGDSGAQSNNYNQHHQHHQHQSHTSNGSRSYSEPFQNWGLEPGKRQRRRRRESTNDKTCTICLECLPSGGGTTLLSCRHKFHDTCLSKWLQNKRTCPNCRQAA